MTQNSPGAGGQTASDSAKQTIVTAISATSRTLQAIVNLGKKTLLRHPIDSSPASEFANNYMRCLH